MLKMKKIIAILLAVCFLVSITAASASAGPDEHHKKFEPPKKHEEHNKKWDHDKPEVTKEVVETLKEVEVDNGILELQLIKCTKETHGHEEVWFVKEWKFVPDDD